MAAAKDHWAISCLAPLALPAVYAEWEKEKPPPTFCGYAVTVDTNSTAGIKAWVLLMRLGAMTGCHQLHERSFFLGGYQFPVCARCTGLFFGQIAGIAMLFWLLQCSIPLLVLFAGISVALLGIDGFFQLKGIWVSTNFRRLATGLLCGFFITGIFIRIITILIVWKTH